MSKASLYFSSFWCFCAVIAFAQAGELGGVKGRYSNWIDELLRSGSYEKLVSPSSGTDLAFTCLETPGDEYYIGVVQNMRIKASISKVQSVVEDFGSYDKLFPGYEEIRVESRSGNRVLTYWENHVPVFFIPNVKYRMIYLLGSAGPDKKIYRYQLEKRGSLLESDGFILLKKISDTETQYLEVDFFNADWGMVKTFAGGRIWPESVDALYESDLAFLLKAEHPDWANERCRDTSVKTVEDMKERPGARCYANRVSDWQHAFPGLPPVNPSK